MRRSCIPDCVVLRYIAEGHDILHSEVHDIGGIRRGLPRRLRLTVRFFVSRGISADHAAELVQAAWAKGWERKHQLRNPDAIVPWIISIAQNIWKTALRAPPTISTDAIEIRSQENSFYLDAKRVLRRSKPKEELLLERFYIQGFGVRDIANQEGVSEEAIRLRLLRARRNARKGVKKALARSATQPTRCK